MEATILKQLNLLLFGLFHFQIALLFIVMGATILKQHILLQNGSICCCNRISVRHRC